MAIKFIQKHKETKSQQQPLPQWQEMKKTTTPIEKTPQALLQHPPQGKEKTEANESG